MIEYAAVIAGICLCGIGLGVWAFDLSNPRRGSGS